MRLLALERHSTEDNAVEMLFRVCPRLLDNFPCLAPNFRRRWFGIAFLIEHDRSNFCRHVDSFFLTLDINPPSDPIEAGLDDDGSLLTAATKHSLAMSCLSLSPN
jgi:hypothetical protein